MLTRKTGLARMVSWVLGVLIAVQPLAVEVAWADDHTMPALDAGSAQRATWESARDDSLLQISGVIKPYPLLKELFRMHNVTLGDAQSYKERAFLDFAYAMSNIYEIMPEAAAHHTSSLLQACKTAFTVYERFHVGLNATVYGPQLLFRTIGTGARVCLFLGNLMPMAEATGLARNMPQAVMAAMSRASHGWHDLMHGSRLIQGLESIAPPAGIRSATAHTRVMTHGTGGGTHAAEAGAHMVHGAEEGGKLFRAASAAGHVVGVGLTVLGLYLEVSHIMHTQDTAAHRYFSWENVSTGITALFCLAALAAMFVSPPLVGTVIGIAASVWYVTKEALNHAASEAAAYNQTYEKSYEFMRMTDDHFTSFCNIVDGLPRTQKAISLQVAEEAYPATGVAALEAEATTEHERAKFEHYRRVRDSAVHQGQLMTYYQDSNKRKPELSPAQLTALWEQRADFMYWRPRPADSGVRWTDVVAAVTITCPPLWPAGLLIEGVTRGKDALMDWQSRRAVEQNTAPRWFFNPDYYLFKKVENYLDRNRPQDPSRPPTPLELNGPYEFLRLRVQQAPFHYIYLVAYDEGTQWNEELVNAAIKADVFISGMKEMEALNRLLQGHDANARQQTQTLRDRLTGSSLRERFGMVAFDDLANTYRDTARRDNEETFAGQLQLLEEWYDLTCSRTPKTAANFIRENRTRIANYLAVETLITAYELVDFIMMRDNIVAMRNTLALFQNHLDQAKAAKDQMKSEFARRGDDDPLYDYLRRGNFKFGDTQFFTSTLANAFNAIFGHPPIEDFDRQTDYAQANLNHTKEAFDEFEQTDFGGRSDLRRDAEEPMYLAGQRTRLFDSITGIDNSLMPGCRPILRKWQGIASETGVTVLISPDDPDVFPPRGEAANPGFYYPFRFDEVTFTAEALTRPGTWNPRPFQPIEVSAGGSGGGGGH